MHTRAEMLSLRRFLFFNAGLFNISLGKKR